MNELVNKIVSLEKDISQEKGKLNLFALFLREDAQDKWDLLVSAPWIQSDKKSALSYIANLIQQRLNNDEKVSLSRIVVIDRNEPAFDAFQKAIHTEHSKVEVRDSNFFGLKIKHAYIITSSR